MFNKINKLSITNKIKAFHNNCDLRKSKMRGFHSYKFLLLFGIFSFFCFSGKLLAQGSKVEIVNANSIQYNSMVFGNVKRLIGNVIFRQSGVTLKCDSAYFFSNNTVDAYGHVHVQKGGSLNIRGELMHYDGNLKLAHILRNVVLVDEKTILHTQAMDYDIKTSSGSYVVGGEIRSGENTLHSQEGYYYSNEHSYLFRRNVIYKNPEYTIHSDTMRLNSITNVASFYGPTHITTKDNKIYCERGWYNSSRSVAELTKKAVVTGKNQYIRADTLYYDKKNEIGKAFSNITMIDTAQNVIMQGNYAEYHKKDQHFLMTNRALIIKIDKPDTLFLHAEKFTSDPDTLPNQKILKAFYKVKLFRPDMQGKCDSMVYTTADSIIRLYKEPVLWNQENQLSANEIRLYTKNRVMDHAEFIGAAFIASKEDSTKFNQIKGKEMIGYFKDNEIYRLNIKGNGQTIYFPKDKDKFIGVNKAESSDLIIYIKDRKVDRIIFLKKPVATLYPLGQLSPQEMILDNFKWEEQYRPHSKEDIFTWENAPQLKQPFNKKKKK